MKKLIIVILVLIATISCSNEPIVDQKDDPILVKYLDAAIKAAYDVHIWMSEENMCIEYECCWEYVPIALRYKYENNEYLTIEDKEAIIEGLELSPSFIDTLDEFDEFYDLYYYKQHVTE